VYVSWGGNLGSDTNTTLADTSSGDLALNTGDTWGLTIQNDDFDPAGPALDPPLGYALRSITDTTYLGPAIWADDVITATFPITAEDDLAHLYRLVLAPGASASLAYFLMTGLAEETEGPVDCEALGTCVTPATGAQIAAVATALEALAAAPDFCDLSAAARAKIVNWPGLTAGCTQPLYLPLVSK
jgi:hypothetical protein